MSDTPRSFHPLLAGVLFGLSAGNLVAGLNLEVASSLAVFPFLLLFALAGLLLALPFQVLSKMAEPQRFFWGTFAAACGLLGWLVESQRELFHAFLPNSIRRLLVTSALLLALSALAGFWAFALGITARRAGRLLLCLCVLFGLAPLSIKKTPDPVQLSSVPEIPKTTPRSVLVIGIEGASWEFVSAAASDGTLPVLKSLIQTGVSGPLESLRPYDRSALWTTAATGKRPMKHRVLSSESWTTPAGALRLLPRPAGLRLFRLPSTGSPPARASLAFWEILAQRGHQSVLANWPAADPPRDGLVLWASERAFEQPQQGGHTLPPGMEERVRLFRTGPEHLERRLSASLLPSGLPEADIARTDPLGMAARDLSVAGLTLATLPTGPASVAAVVFSGLAPVSRVFGPSVASSPYPGRQLRHPDERSSAVTAYYKLLDDLIGDLVEREGPDRTVVVFSPVSFGPAPSLPAAVEFLLGREPAASPERSDPGFIVINGPGIRSGARLTSASVYDLAPTVLVLAGEPIARDLDGRVLGEIFDEKYAERTSFPVVISFEPGGPQ